MSIQEAKQFLIDHTNPSDMSVHELEKYKQALRIVSTAWATVED